MIDSVGGEAKSFFIRDGLGLVWAQRAGIEVGLLSGRPFGGHHEPGGRAGYPDRACRPGRTSAQATEDPGGQRLFRRPMSPTWATIWSTCRSSGARGLSTAPADAVDEVRERVHWVSRHAGGRGAVRELVELVLRARGRWDDHLRSFLA